MTFPTKYTSFKDVSHIRLTLFSTRIVLVFEVNFLNAPRENVDMGCKQAIPP